MNISKNITLLSLLLFSTLLTVSANENYSTIDGSRSKATDQNNYDVYIVSVDGKLKVNKKRLRLKSGLYYVNIASSKTKKFSKSNTITYRSYSLDLKPCVRYLLTAQHASNGFKNDDWTLNIKEEPVGGCEMHPESVVFDPLQDPRTNNFQAEIYALSLRNYLLNNQKQCDNLKSNPKINTWLQVNQHIIDGSNYNIQHLIALQMLLHGEDTALQIFQTIAAMSSEATANMKANFNQESTCDLDMSKLANLSDKWPFNEVYKKFREPLQLNELEQKNWKSALKALQNQSKQID